MTKAAQKLGSEPSAFSNRQAGIVARGNEEIDDAGEECEIKSPTVLSQEIQKLRQSVLKAVAERNILPQPLFWSLFASKLKEIKSKKEGQRIVDELLSKLG